MFRIRKAIIGVSGLLLALSLAIGGGIALAQEATPDGATAGHPVHIHNGTCDTLDPAPLHVLNDIVPSTTSDEVQASEPGAATPVEISTTTVEAPLSEIADGSHSINAHESAENIDIYIACGEIGTLTAATGDQVAIGLREINDSGYTGIAVLQAVGEQTEVTIYLANGLAGDADAAAGGGTPDEAEAVGVAVDIQGFAYDPDPVTVSAGGSITWTNQDSVLHTATALERDALQSGTLDQGESFTQTFETVGTYEYFCEFHADMQGTVIVQ